jgi:hypothetical protein
MENTVIQAAFTESCYSEVRSLECLIIDGRLTIRGVLPKYYSWQLAQQIVAKLGLVADWQITIQRNLD